MSNLDISNNSINSSRGLFTKLTLGLQHVLAMFGATVLVPALTGLNPSLALLGAGLGTLLFHWITGRIVPIFLGSSFAFIGAIQLVLAGSGLSFVKGGLLITGLVYVIVAGLINFFGKDFILKLLPAVVIGPVICVIGLRLSPVALSMSGYNVQDSTFDMQSLLVALVVSLTVIIMSCYSKGFFKIIPIIVGIIVGYLLSMVLGLVDYSAIINAPWIGLSSDAWQDLITTPSFDLFSIVAIAPIALVTMVEHIGDVTANGAVVNKNFITKPGLQRTMLGDGLATSLAAILGAPANTTYSENTGVLAVTKVYDPLVIRYAAFFAIFIALIGKFGGVLSSIPTAVMGGVSFILFGMISAVGLRTLVKADINFNALRNLIIIAAILVLGIAINNVSIFGVAVSGLTLAVFAGIILNLILPQTDRS